MVLQRIDTVAAVISHVFVVYQVQHCDQWKKTEKNLIIHLKSCILYKVPNSSWKQIGIGPIGPLPPTTNGKKIVIVVTDYFSK